MSKIVLDDVISGYGLSKINENFQKVQDELNNKVLYRGNPDGEPNTIEQDVDVNGFSLYNVDKINGVNVDTLTDSVDIVVANMVDINTVADNIDNVNIVAGINEDVTDVAAVATDVSLLAPYAPDIADYATGIYESFASSDAGKGAELVEYQNSTVEAALDIRPPEFANYATLDAYTGDLTAVYVRGVANIFDGGHGVFRRTTDTPVEANGIYRQDDAGRWWKREYTGPAKPEWFGVVYDGTTDCTEPLRKAMAASDSIELSSGSVRVTEPIDITCRYFAGVSKSSGGGLVGDADSFILIDHSVGYGIKVSLTNSVVENIVVMGSSSRASTSNMSNVGVLIEQPDDIAGSGARSVHIRGVTSRSHGGHGFMTSGNCNHSRFDSCTARNCLGHGFLLDNGSERGLVNTERPGQISLIDCRAYSVAGHSIKCGNDDGYGAYRIIVQNFENPDYTTAFYNETLFSKPASAYFYGENITILNSAFGGSMNGVPSISGLYIGGRCSRVIACRYINTYPHAAIVGQGTVKNTEDITIDGLLVSQGFNTANAAVSIETGAKGITVIQRNSDVITTVASGDLTNAIVVSPNLFLVLSTIQANNFLVSGSSGETPFSCTRENGAVGYSATRTGTGASVARFKAAGGGATVETNSNTLTLKQTTVNIAVLPSSSTGLSAGDLWNDAGTLKVKT